MIIKVCDTKQTSAQILQSYLPVIAYKSNINVILVEGIIASGSTILQIRVALDFYWKKIL